MSEPTFDRATLETELVRDEGLRLMPYLDTVGKLTIGVGRCIGDRGISAAEAMVLLGNDIDGIVQELDAYLPWWRGLDPVRQRAMVNLGMMGVGTLMGFHRMLAALQAGDWATAAAELADSDYAREVGARAVRLETILRTGAA